MRTLRGATGRTRRRERGAIEGSKKRVGIVGATGYTGAELVRLIAAHPTMEVAYATSERKAGERLGDECPWLATDLRLVHPDDAPTDVDGVYLCQENGFAAVHAGRYVAQGARVVDLSADHRLLDPAEYERGYGKPHPIPSPPYQVAYGLPEIGHRDSIREAQLVANPGCHVTASVLALWPLAKAGLIQGVPVVDTMTGHSGAGRSRATTEFLFAEGANDTRAYVPIGHRHTPEMEQALRVGGRATRVRFTPHMVPLPRAIFATAHIPVEAGADLPALFREAYADEPFVRVLDSLPKSKATQGSNRCDVHAMYDERTGMAVVLCCLDNLVKGASGAALQNMNLMLGLEETAGLPRDGMWP